MSEATALPPAAQRYLEQLRHESAALPADARQQLLGQISEHLSESAADGSDVDLMLERLGSPRELVAEASANEAVPTPPPWQPSPLLWLAVAMTVIGTIMLLWGGGVFMLSGRGRNLVLAIPGLLLAAGGLVLVVRELRSARDDPSAALVQRRLARGLAFGAIGAGALLLILSGAMIMLTGRGRSLLIAVPGIVLAIIGVVTLFGTARTRRKGS